MGRQESKKAPKKGAIQTVVPGYEGSFKHKLRQQCSDIVFKGSVKKLIQLPYLQ